MINIFIVVNNFTQVRKNLGGELMLLQKREEKYIIFVVK